MSEQVQEAGGRSSHEQLRARLKRFGASRDQSMIGATEIIALGGAALLLVLVVIAYLYFLVPAQSRVASFQLERSRLQEQLRGSQDQIQHDRDTQVTVQRITESLADFENNYLSEPGKGRMRLYDELNELIRKNSLRNTSGPTYVSLLPLGSKDSKAVAKAGNMKWQSTYPGIGVNLTVEGNYQNLRHFIYDIERNGQFIIINSVELERATQQSGSSEAAQPDGAKGSLVSLRLDMATYFQQSAEEVSTTAK